MGRGAVLDVLDLDLDQDVLDLDQDVLGLDRLDVLGLMRVRKFLAKNGLWKMATHHPLVFGFPT